MHGVNSGGASAAYLALRPPFVLGPLQVDPATRMLVGPGGSSMLEPRVLQVLVELADADGAVVTRDQLNAHCWGGRVVGDDAINRCILAVRRAIRELAGDAISIETIPRTGYRLIVAAPAAAPALPPAPLLSRRQWLGGGAVLLASGAGVAALWRRRQADIAAAAARAKAAALLNDPQVDTARRVIAMLEPLIERDPDDVDAVGLSALAWRDIADRAEPMNAVAARTSARRAANRALAILPRQGDALTALATLQPLYGNWTATMERLDIVRSIVPDNIAAMAAMADLYAATGRASAQLPLAAALVQKVPGSQRFVASYFASLWSTGDISAADRVSADAYQRWPAANGAWMQRARFLAATGRADEAVKIVARIQQMQRSYSRVLTTLKLTFAALAEGDEAARQRAVTTARDLAQVSGSTAMVSLAALGANDAAFAAAESYFYTPGTFGALQARLGHYNPQTNLLFHPVMAPLWKDARFLPLLRRIGLVRHWYASTSRPDFAQTGPMPL